MKLLLTSAGARNPSIHDALVGLLGKPIADARALCVPTAQYGHPMCDPASAWRFIAGRAPLPMCDLGWKSVGVLELTALTSIGEQRLAPWVREADVLLVGDDFINWPPPDGSDRALGVVDFSIFPHLGLEPDNSMAAAERWAAGIGGPSYAIDDRTAITVTDGAVEVVSEGDWKYFPGPGRS